MKLGTFRPSAHQKHDGSLRRHRQLASIFLEPLEARALMSSDVFVQTNLVSDGAVPAMTTDANLINPWGMSFGPTTPIWISDNGASVATVYTGAAAKILQVNIPGAGGQAAAPTGQVFNGTSDFVVTNGTASAPALFIFTGEDGGISAWSKTVDPNNAILMVDHSNDGAVFKGLAMVNAGGQNFLLAADFHNAKIDVFNGSFQEVTQPGMFQDPKIPAGFAPFNVQNIGGNVYVTYAKQDAVAHDDVAKAGNGFVDVYTAGGTLVRRLQHGGFLNSPWGVAQAPANWGKFSGDILVGNFGSGHIAAFDPSTGQFRGFLHGADHKRITIDGLWALNFGNGTNATDSNTLYFTAGLNHEADGLFGSLNLMSNKKDNHGMDDARISALQLLHGNA